MLQKTRECRTNGFLCESFCIVVEKKIKNKKKIQSCTTGLYTGILLKNKRVPKLPDFEVLFFLI